jgi:ribose transport system ATP-binding protein
MNDDTLVVAMSDIRKSFPGVQALKGVTFGLHKGEIHGLVGENGAGKSTLVKILTGVLSSDSGSISLYGNRVAIESPRQAQQLGISIIHQELSVLPNLTVGQNIYLGREPRKFLPFWIDWKTLYRMAQEQLQRLNVPISSRTPVAELSVAQRQMVEVARALSLAAGVIVMDEPTSALTEREIESLFSLMRSLKQQGISIIFISHKLEEIVQIADRITVLRDGSLVGSAPVGDLTPNQIVTMMVGRELGEMYPKQEVVRQEVVLSARNLRRGKDLRGVSFELHSGEILGLAGLVGSGRTYVARAIFGADPLEGGEFQLDGRPVRIRSPQEAISLGIGFLPEDRKVQGVLLGLSVSSNIAITRLQNVSRWGVIVFRRLKELALEFVQKLSIRTPGISQLVRNLSGGNQQKVVLAKWLALRPRVLILDEPTRGIDVGAKAEIHTLMNQLAKDGVGILMISSDLPEVLGVSDRILVMHEGTIAGEFSRREASPDKIMLCATGGKADRD